MICPGTQSQGLPRFDPGRSEAKDWACDQKLKWQEKGAGQATKVWVVGGCCVWRKGLYPGG